MAREIERLTPAKVKNAKAGMHPDGGGLYLQVKESAMTPGQLKERQMGLGSLKTCPWARVLMRHSSV